MSDISQKEGSFSPEQEIRELEERLAEKRRELEAHKKPMPEEKELFREVLKEHIQQVRPQAPALSIAPPVVLPPDDTGSHAGYDDEIRALVERALTRSIEDAVAAAQKTTPYLLDELHDHLADDFYDKLIASRKLQSL